MHKQKLFFAGALSCLVVSVVSCKRELPASRPLDTGAAVNNINAGTPPNYGVTLGQVTTVNTNMPVSPRSAVTTDAAGNIFVCETATNTIKVISPTGAAGIFAGDGHAGFKDGPRLSAEFNNPTGLAFDKTGNLYVADMNNQRIRIVTIDGNVSTYAGSGVQGFGDGPGTTAKFNNPAGVAVDTAGTVYVTDQGNNRIRRISTARVVSQWVGDGTAGYRDGVGALTEFNTPAGITVTANGIVYVADMYNNRIRRIISGTVTSLAGGSSTVNADGAGSAAGFYFPTGVAVDAIGNVYIADQGNNRIRKATPGGVVTTVAGNYNGFADGLGSAALFYSPHDLAIDLHGTIYVSDFVNQRLRRITMMPVVATFAGDGGTGYINANGTAAEINQPYGMAVDASGNAYTLDADYRVRKISPSGDVSLLAGSGQPGFADGKGEAASFVTSATNLLTDPAGNVYVADGNNQRIRKIAPDGTVSTYAGNGVQGQDTGSITGAVMNTPSAMAFDAAGNMLVSQYYPGTIRKITPAGRISTLATLPKLANGALPIPIHMATDAAGNAYVVSFNQGTVYKVSTTGVVSVFGTMNGSAGFAPSGITVDKATGKVYIMDLYHNVVYVCSTAGQLIGQIGTYSSIYGYQDGLEAGAKFNQPKAIAVGGQFIYIADQYNNRIRILSKR